MHTDAQLQETRYSVKTSACAITWTTYTSQVNKGVIHHRDTCTQSLKQTTALIEPIMEKLYGASNPAPPFKTLFWGRLAPGGGHSGSDMAFRLALAAHTSGLWDNRHGKPIRGHENEAVIELARCTPLAPELAGLFSRFGLTLGVTSAEKVLIAGAGTLPFYKRLQQHGVAPEEKLPYDCLTWFSITPGTFALAGTWHSTKIIHPKDPVFAGTAPDTTPGRIVFTFGPNRTFAFGWDDRHESGTYAVRGQVLELVSCRTNEKTECRFVLNQGRLTMTMDDGFVFELKAAGVQSLSSPKRRGLRMPPKGWHE